VRGKFLLALVAIAGLAIVLTVLNLLSLWQINDEAGTFSMAPTLPPCNGRVLAEGLTYLFRDPHRGEIVMFRARLSPGGDVIPSAHRYSLQVNKRVIGPVRLANTNACGSKKSPRSAASSSSRLISCSGTASARRERADFGAVRVPSRESWKSTRTIGSFAARSKRSNGSSVRNRFAKRSSVTCRRS